MQFFRSCVFLLVISNVCVQGVVAVFRGRGSKSLATLPPSAVGKGDADEKQNQKGVLTTF